MNMCICIIYIFASSFHVLTCCFMQRHLDHFEQRINNCKSIKPTLLTLLNTYLSSEVCRNSTPDQNKTVGEDMEMIISFVDFLEEKYSVKN